MENKSEKGKVPNGFAFNLMHITQCGYSLGKTGLTELWEICICEIFPDDVYIHKIEYDDGIWIYIYSYLERKIVNQYKELLDSLAKEVGEIYNTEVRIIFNYADDEDRYEFLDIKKYEI